MLAIWGCTTFPKPTLSLDFLGATSLDSGITFTRASNATYFNSAGVLTTAGSGVARFDYNPSTLQPRGLLIEEQRANLLLQSQAFDNAVWTTGSTASVTADNATAPDGTNTAELLAEAANTGYHYIEGAVGTNRPSVVSGSSYSFSIFFKKGTGATAPDIIQLTWGAGGFATSIAANFDISVGGATSGTVTYSGAGTTATINFVGNGWYRCTIAATANASTATTLNVAFVNNNPTQVRFSGGGYLGQTTSNIFIWGAQLEAGAFPTSYIPTTTTALTRNADVASMTGTNFSSWYSASEGTFYSESQLTRQSSAGGTGIVESTDGSANNVMRVFYRASGATGVNVFTSGSLIVDLTPTGVITANQTFKDAFAYKVNDFAASGNGAAVVTDTSGTVPVVDQLNIGRIVGLATLNGYVRRLAFYPTRLPNTTLQALTA